MKNYFVSAVFIAALSGCGGDRFNPLGMRDTEKSWNNEEAPGPTLAVRGKNYDLTRRTVRYKDTNEVFFVEYYATVKGRRVTCVGDPNSCERSIIREFEDPKSDHD
ncbi:MAG: hypothetical protein ACR2O1_14600 [Boseongicola sp.]